MSDFIFGDKGNSKYREHAKAYREQQEREDKRKVSSVLAQIKKLDKKHDKEIESKSKFAKKHGMREHEAMSLKKFKTGIKINLPRAPPILPRR